MPAMPYKNVTPDDLFKCRKCGDCCKGYGGTYLSLHDIAAISDFIRISSDQFMKDYCSFSGSRPILTQKSDGYCIFWDEVCTIHPVKPRMCKAWPFISPVVADPANWTIMAGSCPGIQTGFPLEVIKTCVLKIIQAASGPVSGGRL
jgi:Fe-S-cluster containining protein